MNQIDNLSINSIRILSADAIQKANSGHPGLPLGCAAIGYEVWANQMNHNPANPGWANKGPFCVVGRTRLHAAVFPPSFIRIRRTV